MTKTTSPASALDFAFTLGQTSDMFSGFAERSASAAQRLADSVQANAAAVLESGQALNAGAMELGLKALAEGQENFAAIAQDWQALVALRSPSEQMLFQAELARRNAEAAVAACLRNSQAFGALANKVLVPLVARLSDPTGVLEAA